jgi:hypothetical protein
MTAPESLSAAPSSSAQAGVRRLSRVWAVVLPAAVVSILAITSRSLWIDEALTAVKAMQPNLSAWWQEMNRIRNSDLQMPLYMAYMWGWAKVFGHTEWFLRAANIPFFVSGAVALVLAARQAPRPPSEKRNWVPLLLLTLLWPFAWYCLDEARPYAMQFGASCFIAASLIQLSRTEARESNSSWTALLLFGVVLLYGSSLLGVIWVAAACGLLVFLCGWARLKPLVRQSWVSWCATGLVLAGLSVYYVWTLYVGARASRTATTTLGAVLYAPYELLGFNGLGPGRLEMRTADLAVLHPYVGWIAAYAMALTCVGSAAFLALSMRWSRKFWGIAFLCAWPVIVLVAAGFLLHFRVLGRHLTPVAAALLLFLNVGFSALWSDRRSFGRVITVCFLGLLAVSCLSLRLSARHGKDDYRSAVAFSLDALQSGKVVWWNAAAEGGLYYGLPLIDRPDARIKNVALFLMNPEEADLQKWPAPDFVVASKPDSYDTPGNLGRYLQAKNFRNIREFPAFTVWAPITERK